MKSKHKHLAVAALGAVIAGGVAAGSAWAQSGKLLLTGGVSSIDGAAGGGLTPWALVGSNATDGEVGATVHRTRLATQDYGLTAYGVTLGYRDWLEVSLARQDFDASPTTLLNGIAPFGVKPGQHVNMDVLGVKVRVAGEAVLDTLTWMPQVAIGLEHKQVSPGSLQSVFDFLGTHTSGTDVYVSATKLFLADGLLLNGTLRNTNANQNGLLGFGAGGPGAPSEGGRKWQPEFSVAYLLNRTLAVGAEVRFKPNALESVGRRAGLADALQEDDWKDLFVAWAPDKSLSMTLAYVDLGRVIPGITGNRKQSGWYLSGQFAF